MSGTVDRRGTSVGKKLGIIVTIFIVVGVIVDSMNNWHILHMLTKH